MARQDRVGAESVASVLATHLAIEPAAAARLADGAEIDKVRSQSSVTGEAAFVVRGAVKLVAGDVVLDVARAPYLALAGAWRVVALRSSLVVSLDPKKLAAHPDAVARAHARVAGSFAKRIEARAAPTVEARLERLLADLARRYGAQVSGGVFVALPLRGRDVASLVGTSVESVSRIFAAWKRSGRIRATREGIWIRA